MYTPPTEAGLTNNEDDFRGYCAKTYFVSLLSLNNGVITSDSGHGRKRFSRRRLNDYHFYLDRAVIIHYALLVSLSS